MQKANLFIISFLSLVTVFFSCQDGNIIGGSIQPDQDKITVYYDTVHVVSSTVLVDSMLYRSSSAYLGEFTDKYFGTTKPDFLAQLYCPYRFTFPDDVKRIDSSYLYLYYEDWFGDSTALMHLNVYEMNRPMVSGQAYYTNINPGYYCDKSKFLGSTSFTAADMYSSDSVKNLDDYETVIKVPVTTELGNRFLRDYRKNPAYFASPNAFANYFNGLYVTTNYGNGSIINIKHCELELCYGTYLYSKNSGGLRDSFVIGASYFPITKEVKQVNRFEHPDLTSYINPGDKNDSLNYVFSPGGLYTKISIPSKVFDKLSGTSINSMRLKVNATQLDETKYGMTPPAKMLLIRESDSRKFFSRFEMNDGLYSFLADYNSDDKTYSFDLSYYAQKMVRKHDDPESTTFVPFYDMLMIPVTVIESTDGTEIRLEQSLTPCAVKVRGARHLKSPMKLEMVYSKGKIN